MDERTRRILASDADLKKIHDTIQKVEDWTKLPSQPMVTISVSAYNQVNYIEQAINSMLMQKVSFEFEIIVKDDLSTDGTREILLNYQRKYPNIIRLWLCKENLFQKKLKAKLDLFARGKYIARCEGDDYWTDELKLQTQYELMEKYPEASMCAHDFIIHYEHTDEKDVLATEKFKYLTSTKLDQNIELYKINIESYIQRLDGLHTATNFFKNDLITNEFQSSKGEVVSGDYLLKLLLLQKGYCIFIPKVMSVLRKNPGGLTQQKRSHLQNFKIQEKQLPILIHFAPEPLKKYFYKRLWKIYPNYILGRKGITKDVNITDRIKAVKPFLVALFKSL